MHEWYAAPMEGLTGWRWRQVQHEMFGGAALYVTPFVSPNGNFSFQRKELEELDPERNRGIPVVPQILTNRAEYFVWAAKECRSRGWEQVDLNLGCPSGTVTGKNKGAGLLRQPELLRQLLDGIFDALPDMKISVKTPYRMGEGGGVAGAAGPVGDIPYLPPDGASTGADAVLQGDGRPGGVPLDGRAHGAASVLQRGRHHRP